MKRYLSLFLLLFALFFVVDAQRLSDYRLLFDKRDMGDGALRVQCQFTIDFAQSDSIALDFGGNFEDMAVEEMKISPESIRYVFDPEARQITFYKAGEDTMSVKMEYIFMNLTAVFMYGSKGAEVWETIYSVGGEFYYPMSRGMVYSGEVKFICPPSLSVVAMGGRDMSQWQAVEQCVPLNFVFLEKERYEKKRLDGPYKCDVYQLVGQQADSLRFDELCRLATMSVQWFESKYDDGFISPMLGTQEYPAFVFHNGNSAFNRYNMGFISASQEKFATYPHIYPLVHEIGHRWIGEYSMFVDEGERGYAFMIESLNEFMTLMCIRDIVGIEEYERLIERYRTLCDEIKGTEQDIHPYDVLRNDNIVVTYRKGPVMLDSIAREIGYDKVVDAIVRFYKACHAQPNLQWSDFERQCDIEL